MHWIRLKHKQTFWSSNKNSMHIWRFKCLKFVPKCTIIQSLIQYPHSLFSVHLERHLLNRSTHLEYYLSIYHHQRMIFSKSLFVASPVVSFLDKKSTFQISEPVTDLACFLTADNDNCSAYVQYHFKLAPAS